MSLQGVYYDYAEGNEETLQSSRKLPFIIPAATIDPRRFYARRGEALNLESFAALRVFPDLQGWPVDYAPFARTVRAAAGRGLPVMVAALAPGDITAMGRALAESAGALVVTGVNISHTPLVAEAIAVGRDAPQMYFETSRVENEETMELLAGELGVGRLVFGTGLPFQYPSSALAVLRECGLSREEKTAVLGGNARRLMGLTIGG